MKSSREVIMDSLIDDGIFNYAHFISNEVNTSTLTLFKALAKFFNLPFYESNKISTSNYSEKMKEKEYTGWLKEAVDKFGFYWEDYWSQLEPYMPFCYKYANIPVNSSVAASGVIMGENIPILPVQDNAFRMNGADLEEVGFIKYDLLSVNTLNLVGHFEGLNPDWNPKDRIVININDKKYSFDMKDEIELENGSKITAEELSKKLKNGEAIDVKL